MPTYGLEIIQDLGISGWLRRLNKYGMKLGSALDNAVVAERTLGSLFNSTLNERIIERIVSARERLADQVDIARKGGDAARIDLAEEAVLEYWAVFDPQRAELAMKTRDELKHPPLRIAYQDDIESDGKLGINKWDDGYGNIIFTGRISPGDIHELSRQISAQREAFGKLSDEEKSSIDAEFSVSKGKIGSSRQYSAYLQSETLARRFQELAEQNPPILFEKKS